MSKYGLRILEETVAGKQFSYIACENQNTASISQSLFNSDNFSNYAMSALWQEWRDEADWLNTSSENATARNHNMALAALERATMFELSDEAAKGDLLKLLGKFGFEFLK